MGSMGERTSDKNHAIVTIGKFFEITIRSCIPEIVISKFPFITDPDEKFFENDVDAAVALDTDREEKGGFKALCKAQKIRTPPSHTGPNPQHASNTQRKDIADV